MSVLEIMELVAVLAALAGAGYASLKASQKDGFQLEDVEALKADTREELDAVWNKVKDLEKKHSETKKPKKAKK